MLQSARCAGSKGCGGENSPSGTRASRHQHQCGAYRDSVMVEIILVEIPPQPRDFGSEADLFYFPKKIALECNMWYPRKGLIEDEGEAMRKGRKYQRLVRRIRDQTLRKLKRQQNRPPTQGQTVGRQNGNIHKNSRGEKKRFYKRKVFAFDFKRRRIGNPRRER